MCVDVRSVSQEHFYHVSTANGLDNWGEAVLIPFIHIGFVIEQELDHPCVASLRCEMKRGFAPDSVLIDGGVVGYQEFDHFRFSILSRHDQRRAAVKTNLVNQ